MQFKTLAIKNFMSIGDAEIEFDNGHLVLIEGRNLDEGGSNGAGKSSIWDAISFALFGQTVRGLKGDEVINRVADKDCTVRLVFELKGKIYSVVRIRGKVSGLVVFKGDEKIELGTQAQTQEWLLSDLGIDFELFRCTVLFAQEETFNFVNATNKQQKEILSKIMRLNYDDYLAKAKEKYAEAEEELSSIDTKLSVLRSHLVEDTEALFANEIVEWQLEQKKFLEEINDRIKELKPKVSVPDEARMEQIQSAMTKMDSNIKKVDSILAQMNAKILSKGEEVSRLKRVMANSECPTCGSSVDIEDFSKSLDKVYGEINILRASKKEKEALLKKMQDKKITLNEMWATTKSEIAIAKQNDHALRSAMQKKEELKTRVNPWLKKKEEAIEKQAQIREKIADLSSKSESIKETLPYYEFWTRAFGDAGIKSFVFDLICATLTNRANNYLNKMTGGAVTISFDTQVKLKSGELRDKFDCVVMKDGQRVPYISYSGGEKRRVSLAVDMALSDLMSDYYGSKFNVVVFDEQTNYLDRAGRESFMGLLRDVAKDKTVFVVDHDAEFKAMFDEVLTVEKHHGISRIV